MYSFKQFLREGLTHWQNELAQKAAAKRPPGVLRQTDHYFGKGVDEKKTTITDPGSKKTPTHQAVEQHLGREISHSDYQDGLVATDAKKPKNRTKIGKLITDRHLRNAFNGDQSRANDGSYKYLPVIQHSDEHHEIVAQRGAHVAGMSNSESTAEHPTGHPWAHPAEKFDSAGRGTGSCMTHPSHTDIVHMEDEDEKTTLDILHGHVSHGGVVLYGRKNGIDRYREFRVPYKNNAGHVIFHKNNSFGEHHPAFMDAADKEATKLSGPRRGGIVYHAQRDKFYVEGPNAKVHPDATPKDIANALNPKHPDFETKKSREFLARSMKTPEHFKHFVHDPDPEVRQISVLNDRAPDSHLETMRRDPHPVVQAQAERRIKERSVYKRKDVE